jgi:hypothetical protein
MILAACNGIGVSPSAAATEPGAARPSSAPASPVAVATPAPTAIHATSLDYLPTASYQPSKISVACDAATLGTSPSMTCDEILAITAGIATTMSTNPVTQVSVTNSPDNANGIQVTFWVQAEDASGVTAFTSTIDPANETFTLPEEDSEAVFPAAS